MREKLEEKWGYFGYEELWCKNKNKKIFYKIY